MISKEIKHELMLKLESMITELPQYRKITNEMCNRYISNYVTEQYEQKFIDNGLTTKNYAWDIYDVIPINWLEDILDYLKESD